MKNHTVKKGPNPPLPYTVRAEVRGVEEGHKTYLMDDGRYRVLSESQDGVHYFVTVEGRQPGAWIILRCTCPAGQHPRHVMIPCKHAALVGRRLEREREAVWDDSLKFWKRPGEMTVETADDVFARLQSFQQ